VNPVSKTLLVTTRLKPGETFTIEYDYLVCAPGAQVNSFGLATVEKYCHFIKDVEGIKRIKNKLLDNFEQAAFPGTPVEKIKQLLSFAVVGGGPTGVEFSGELEDIVSDDLAVIYPQLIQYVTITLINSGPSLLQAFDKNLQEEAAQALVKRGVQVKLNTRVTKIEEDYLIYSAKEKKLAVTNTTDVPAPAAKPKEVRLPFGLCVWAAGTAPRSITQKIAEKIGDLQVQSVAKAGRLQVDRWLRVQGLPEDLTGSILAMGDCSIVVGGEEGQLPQTAQVAGQQGAYMARLLNKAYNLTIADAPALPKDRWYRSFLPEARPFRFLNLGLLAYVGGSQAVAQVQLGDSEFLKTSGSKAYLLWKSVYLVKQVRAKEKASYFH
jgi:NADH dehydrogenase FAD-containing subunit